MSLSLFACLLAASAQESDVLFHASFDGAVAAMAASGALSPQKTPGKLLFEEGMRGKASAARVARRLPAFATGIELVVTGGKANVTDWVAEATLDLGAARGLLGARGRPDQVAVYELDDLGNVSNRVASQVDRARSKGLFTVAWRVPGKLAAGATRRFLLTFRAAKDTEGEGPSVEVKSDKNTITVTNGDLQLEHVRGIGGMIRRVTLGDASASLTWNDKIFDGQVYYLAKHSAERMEVKAAGPLRAVVEAEGEYLDAGKSPAAKPRGRYRFTTYAGLPFTLIEGTVTQDFAHQWRSLAFVEMQIGGGGLTHYATDNAGGRLERAGTFYGGSHWAAAYNDKVLIATCASRSPGVWDGGGEHYGAYVRSGVSPMTTLLLPWKGAILFGAGDKALKDKTVQQWSEILADPPAVRIAFDKLGLRVAQVAQVVREREDSLANLTGKAWAQTHVAVTLARQQAQIAREKFQSGAFRECLAAIKTCEEALDISEGKAQIQTEGAIQAGVVMGHPFLANDRVAYLWSRPEDGAGLMSIFDRESGREMLKAHPSEAPFWEITVKRGKGGKTYKSVGTPCEVTGDAPGDEGQISFRWSDGVGVEVEARLGAEDPFLRLRLAASSGTASTGLVNVAFPVVTGIAPLTDGARRDTILETWGLGWEKPSPLVTGKVSNVSGSTYPRGMQFTALLGDGHGLYFAEEDGDANRKQILWTPDADTGTLAFSISHPVLNWGADEPVVEYTLPGDAVLGPFRGDWYDAARIYRKWALTAPWCAKGLIYEREDYPKWLINAPYWTLSHIGDEAGIQRELDKQAFYEIPVMVAHTYNWFFGLLQGDRRPEYFPPKLGSEGFKQAVAQLQEKGIRVVPYIDGFLVEWDTDSYRMKDGDNTIAIWDSNGKATRVASYRRNDTLACPAAPQRRKDVLEIAKELVGRYGVDGIYFDWLSVNTHDCFNPAHGHPIAGGNFWTKSTHDLYEQVRTECKKLNPQFLLTGEDIAEYCIDVQDTFLCLGRTGSNAPLFQAVYHGYANVFGGGKNKCKPVYLGRWWLLGAQNGWHNTEGAMIGNPPYERFAASGRYYKRLLRCRWEFAAPYLGYGEMLRPPKIEGELPTITVKDTYHTFTAQAVEGSAWKAPDGTVGVFFLNYDDKNAHEATWSVDLAETGIDASKKVRISRWTPDEGLAPVKETAGGVVSETMEAKPLDIIAFKLEVVE